jgi:hypothetical protein
MKQEMQQDEFASALSGEAGIIPSSGFVSGVMDAVRREASAPPSIPFPWTRALPGLVAGVFAMAAMIGVLAKNSSYAPPNGSFLGSVLPDWKHSLDVVNMYGLGWVLMAILVTMTCVSVAMRLTTGIWRTR